MLNFEEIEDCFPEYGALCAVDGRVTVSAQWLHDFAHAVSAKEREACATECEAEAAEAFRDDEEAWGRGACMCVARIRERSNVK